MFATPNRSGAVISTVIRVLVQGHLLLASGVCLATDLADDRLATKPETIEAWKEMRFGMFVCWGPVSLTGKEIGWSRGREMYRHRWRRNQGEKLPIAIRVHKGAWQHPS